MGAGRTFVLHGACPDDDDASMAAFLEVAAALCAAPWLELHLEPVGSDPARRYKQGSRTAGGCSLNFDLGNRFRATLDLGAPDPPAAEIVVVLARCLETALEFARMAQENVLLRGVIDATSSAVLLFSEGGDIVHANPPADDLLSLQTEDNLIIESGDHAGQPLFKALCSVVEGVAAQDAGSATMTTVFRVAGGREMICEVVRLRQAAAADSSAVMVVLRTPRGETEVRIDAFSAAYGLSPREQEVVQRLLKGSSTAEMASELGISPHTVRDHLKHLYRKTGSSSRSELLGLLSRESGTENANLGSRSR